VKVQGVYRIALGDGRCYIGSSVDVVRRWKEHRRLLDAGEHHSAYLQRAWQKHGADAFTFHVVEQCERSAFVAREQHWIDASDSVFNLAKVAGSRLGVPQSPETIEKVRAIHLGRKNSPETLARMSIAQKGILKPQAGRPRTAEHKAAISLAQRTRIRVGRPMSEETKAKIAAAQRGKPRDYARGQRSPEWIESMRAAALANSDNRRRAALARWAKERGAPC
jgi:group I intron endonuclease